MPPKSHGMSRTLLYKKWQKMRERCKNPRKRDYHHYGGRGIRVCKEWDEAFEPFYEWAMAAGYREDLTLDRIDVNGNYGPSNCRWATWKEQRRNTRYTLRVTVNGEARLLIEISEETGIPYETLRSRIQFGYTEDELLCDKHEVHNKRMRAHFQPCGLRQVEVSSTSDPN